ncbi:hypothetical protein BDR26DRAFT_1010299 [Obelidium mucronatum]|nr:hypothetical protein BDR26DRAFT_1010299 [Obelidium mucronatum]
MMADHIATTAGSRKLRRASSFDSYAGLLETVKTKVKEGLGEKKKVPKKGKHDEEEDDTSSDDLGWEFSDAEDDDIQSQCDSPVAPLPFRQDLDPENDLSYDLVVKRSKTVTAMLLQDDESQEQLEDVFHGELKKADIFIDLHERYFANRAEIMREDPSEKPSDSQLIQDILTEAGVEGMSVRDLEAMFPSKNLSSPALKPEKKASGYELSKGSHGFERFIPTAIPNFFNNNNNNNNNS